MDGSMVGWLICLFNVLRDSHEQIVSQYLHSKSNYGLGITKIIVRIKKLRGLSPQANYTDRATASSRRS
jgi:hypothetical protein